MGLQCERRAITYLEKVIQLERNVIVVLVWPKLRVNGVSHF
jgi:hypothetical protein